MCVNLFAVCVVGVCVCLCVYVCARACVFVHVMVCGGCVCMCIQVCIRACERISPSFYACLFVCYSNTDSLMRSEPSNGRPGFVFAEDRDDLNTDTRDDLEIRTGSCSADQMAIRIQNRVISCECLFIGLF